MPSTKLGYVVLLGIVAVLIASPMASAVSVRSKVVQVTFDHNRDAETTIAINPVNPQNVVAGWIQSAADGSTCAVGASFNGGRTWTYAPLPGIILRDGGAFDVGTDPGVAFDAFGNAYYTCLAFDLFPPGTGSAGVIFVSKSVDGGVTWGDPVPALAGVQVNEFQDHQFITTNPATGAVYVTETEFTSFGKGAILFTKSTDQGATWSPKIQVNRFSQAAWFQDSFSATGMDPNTIYVTYGAGSNAGLPNFNEIWIAKSIDGGASFRPAQRLMDIVPLPDPLPNAPWRSDNNLFVAVDRSTNQIYVNFADYSNGDADIFVMRVWDAGDRFVVQDVSRVNDDPAGNGADQFFPFITVAPGGRVDVCFQDRRYAPGNALIFTTCAFSWDGALSFANFQVTRESFDASNNRFIGDYNYQASTEKVVLSIFVGDGVPGGESRDQEVFVARVTL